MRKFRYSTNMMGPWHLNWYEERGLLKDNRITQQYCAGRIDVRGGDTGPYGDEIGLPPMKNNSWFRFGDWLQTFETDEMWSIKDLVWMFERANPKIEWYECPEWYSETYDPSKGIE